MSGWFFIQLVFLACSVVSALEKGDLSLSIQSERNHDSFSFECNQKGYLDYLGKWSIEEKSTSRNPSSPEFKQRLEYFIDSCMKIHDWNSYDKYPMEFTFYADWHPEEFEKLASTSQRYSGIKTPVPATVPTYNNSNLRYLLPSLDPCDDIIEEGNTLRSVISMPQNCSVSWAFAVTNSIEYAIKKFYLEEFNQEISIALSAQELIDCVGKEHGLEDACEGMPIAWGFDYAFENGIAYRQFYPHTNVEGECQDIPDEHKYHIAGYEKPHVYNKLGLFEMLQKGPVAVTLGLDPEFFQYYQSDRENGPYFDTAFWRPSVYGVVIEYNQYEEEGKEGYTEWPFFAIETRLRACDSMIFRLPIRSTLSDANIAGIAGFAIRPLVMETIPESILPTKAPTQQPPTQQPTTEPVTPTTIAPTEPVAPTTLPPTTLPPTTLPPTTLPPTTLPPTTQLPTTLPPTTLPTTTLPPTQQPTIPTTLSPTTQQPTTIAPTTLPPTTLPPTTLPPTTLPPTQPPTTLPTTTLPTTTLPPTQSPTQPPTTLPPTEEPTELPTSFICNENIYPTIESIPSYATELVFEENSYPSVQTLDLSRFSQLQSFIVLDGAFANCYYVYIDNSLLSIISIGNDCFSGLAPSEEERRLSDLPPAFVIANAPTLITISIGSNSLANVNHLEIDNLLIADMNVTIGSGSFSSINSINVGISSIIHDIASSLASSIESANPGKTIPVIITTVAPSTEEPTVSPTPSICTAGSLTVNKDRYCSKITTNHWNSITINEDRCNSLSSTLDISNNPCLTTLVIKKNSLKNVKTLIISNNPLLRSIVVEGGIGELLISSWNTGVGYYTQSLTIKNLPQLKTIAIGSFSFYSTTSITLSNLPQLTSFNTGLKSFFSISKLTLSSLPKLNTIDVGYKSFYHTKTVIFSDLPKLTRFDAGYKAFHDTTRLTLSSVPFTNGKYTQCLFAFLSLRRSAITYDSISTNLRNQISSHLVLYCVCLTNKNHFHSKKHGYLHYTY